MLVIFIFNVLAFQWDKRSLCSHLSMCADERTCTSLTSLHSFKTVYGPSLVPGFRYHFTILLLKGSNFKLGVSLSRRLLDQAFSDSSDGFAYYSSGYLRNGNKGDGPKYGESYRRKDRVGVYVDMVEGVIFFSKNDKMFGDAFRVKELLTQEVYPACSCLTKGESFELLYPQCEDWEIILKTRNWWSLS